jgi:hypothetical protein
VSQADEGAIPDQDAFFALRNRAYRLADSARYKHWHQVAYALLGEGFASGLIRRLDGAAFAVMMLSRCCASELIHLMHRQNARDCSHAL